MDFGGLDAQTKKKTLLVGVRSYVGVGFMCGAPITVTAAGELE